MREIKRLVLHCTDSTFGDVVNIDLWHKKRSWRCCGYHFVILNGIRNYQDTYVEELDGTVEKGRHVSRMGAGVRGNNRDTVHVSLVGKQHYTKKQITSLYSICLTLLYIYNLTPDAVIAHKELDSNKKDPFLDMSEFRASLWAMYNGNHTLCNKRR